MMLFSSTYIATIADVKHYHHSAVGGFEIWGGWVRGSMTLVVENSEHAFNVM